MARTDAAHPPRITAKQFKLLNSQECDGTAAATYILANMNTKTNDRKRVAIYLRSIGWTMAKIARQLRVSPSRVRQILDSESRQMNQQARMYHALNGLPITNALKSNHDLKL